MSDERPPDPGHYGALGVPACASPRQIELAFLAWGARRAAGSASPEAYRRAEAAYYVLTSPCARSRHDRQLGLLPHPAWRSEGERSARRLIGSALRDLGEGRVGRARQLLTRAVRDAPESPPARSYLGLALARGGSDFHEAVRHALYAVERQPREAVFLFNLAEIYALAGLRTRALATRARGWRIAAAAAIRGGTRM